MNNTSPENPRVLITGGYGCIGAETTRWLLHHTDAAVFVCSRTATRERSRQVFGQLAERITFTEADVTDQSRLTHLLIEHQITHVAHMAGLQTPDCNANRDLGLQINLAGTQNMIEAMKASGLAIARFVFASSMAVYGPRADYPPERIPMLSATRPVNVYGTWKLAGEQLARLFAAETGVPTISVRPGALFGPGRDAGLTSSPTNALKHLARGLPFQIPYRNEQDYLYVPDVGAAVGNTLIAPFEGYAAFTLPSHTLATPAFVDAMKLAAEELGIADQFNITIGDDEVPFVCDLDFDPFLKAFPDTPLTPFTDAVRESLEAFRATAQT